MNTSTAASTPTPTDVALTGTPTSTATNTGTEWTAYKSTFGVSFPIPVDLTPVESTASLELQNGEQVSQTVVTFRNADSRTVLSFVATPDSENTSVETWVRAYPGWPGEPTFLQIAGGDALLFEQDQVGDDNATVYFLTGNYVFSLRGNTGTTSGSNGPVPRSLDRADFSYVVAGILVE